MTSSIFNGDGIFYFHLQLGYDMTYSFKINPTQKITPTQIKINPTQIEIKPKIKPNLSLLPLHRSQPLSHSNMEDKGTKKKNPYL
jgi:hypothetical protein